MFLEILGLNLVSVFFQNAQHDVFLEFSWFFELLQ